MEKYCVLCAEPVSELEDSAEHLILAAIGGRRKVRGVLCRKCNSSSGAEWDSELARQLNPLALIFGVERQQGEVPAQVFETASSGRFRLDADGSLSPAMPLYRKDPKEGGGFSIQVGARTMAEARRILSGIARKYPEVDYAEVLASAESKTEYLDDPLKMSLWVGGPLAGRSIVKSALCLAAASGVDPAECVTARRYLTDSASEACFGFYQAPDLIRCRPAQTPIHCVAVSNHGTEGQLLGYAEFFGFHRIVVCLTDDYRGEPIHVSYAIDPTTAQELELDVNLALRPAEVAACFAYERIPTGAYEGVLRELMPTAQKRSFERERDRAARRAIEHAFKACGVAEGGELPAEKYREFSRLLTEQMMPFVRRYSIRGRRVQE